MLRGKNPDSRVKSRYFSVPAYIVSSLMIAALVILPTVWFGGPDLILNYSKPYLKWFFVYCLFITALSFLLFGLQKYFLFDKHMKTLSVAARKVAQGDFSIYLPTRHRADRLDDIDGLFLDFNTMVEELGSIETLKNDFVANVSHELKTPLAVMHNYAQLLQTTDLTVQQEEYVGEIEESIENLSSLIFNILKLNKLESQKIQTKPAVYDLCRQLEDCALKFESIWESKNIDFDVEMEEDVAVCADRELMKLVWNNLLSNAFKFTEPGGCVILRQSSTERDVLVEVKDNGCGMRPEVMRHIFDKFYQGDTSHSTEGNGLGLAMVWRVLQMSGGAITVESEPGAGAKFTVRLPKENFDDIDKGVVEEWQS